MEGNSTDDVGIHFTIRGGMKNASCEIISRTI